MIQKSEEVIPKVDIKRENENTTPPPYSTVNNGDYTSGNISAASLTDKNLTRTHFSDIFDMTCNGTSSNSSQISSNSFSQISVVNGSLDNRLSGSICNFPSAGKEASCENDSKQQIDNSSNNYLQELTQQDQNQRPPSSIH